MKFLALALALLVTSAIADDAKVSVPSAALKKLMDENTELRKEVNQLEADNDALFDKLRKQMGMVGSCT